MQFETSLLLLFMTAEARAEPADWENQHMFRINKEHSAWHRWSERVGTGTGHPWVHAAHRNFERIA